MRQRRIGVTGLVIAVAVIVTACTSSNAPAVSGASSPPTSTAAVTSTASIPVAGGTLSTSTIALPNGAVRRAIPLPWDRAPEQDLQVAAAGLSLTSSETLQVHYHAHLDVIVYGAAVPVPAGLGINVGPNNSAPPHGSPGIAPLHTHDTSGILHIEAPAQQAFTLGQVFTEWGIVITTGQVGAYRTGDGVGDTVSVFVDGTKVTGDPAQIVLKAHEEIAIVVAAPGKATATPPTSYTFPAGD